MNFTEIHKIMDPWLRGAAKAESRNPGLVFPRNSLYIYWASNEFSTSLYPSGFAILLSSTLPKTTATNKATKKTATSDTLMMSHGGTEKLMTLGPLTGTYCVELEWRHWRPMDDSLTFEPERDLCQLSPNPKCTINRL